MEAAAPSGKSVVDAPEEELKQVWLWPADI